MPVDFSKLKKEIGTIADNAAQSTDNQLASRISAITTLTNEEVKKLFPKTEDVKKLVELMEIVKSSQDRNDKINRIVTNAEDFGGIILTLLNRFT